MKKAKKINDNIIVYNVPPVKLDGIDILCEEDYLKLGFKDFIEPKLLEGQSYGDLYEDVTSNIYTIEVVELPKLSTNQKLGEKIQDPNTKIFTYTVIDKSTEDIEVEDNIILTILNISKSVLLLKLETDTDELIKSIVGERSSEYEIAEKEAVAYKEAGYPEENIPLSISSDAIANRYSNTVACDSILAMAAKWKSIQTDIRFNRLILKANTKNALTIEELTSIELSWNEFLIKTNPAIVTST